LGRRFRCSGVLFVLTWAGGRGSGWHARHGLVGSEVLNNGVLNKSSGAVSATKPGTGLYIVTFDRDISDCFYSGAHTNPGDFLNPGMTLQINPSGDNVKALRVRLENTQTHTATDAAFHVTVFCSR
jgi:hypothetical protein